ncbi:hypothetical protein IT407_04150 [Candidatus Uhrbacteria bacterium]|nr:hypothetical protein [Candidatus Uhrbacteria bacterium]
MTSNHRRFIPAFCAIFALSVLCPLPGCQGLGPGTTGSAESLRVPCDDTCGCAPYAHCVSGGTVWCEGGSCLSNGRVTDLTCVDAVDRMCTPYVPPLVDAGFMPPSLCGSVSAPIEQANQTPDRIRCTYIRPRPSDARYEFGWIVVTADRPGATFELIRGNVLGVRYDNVIESVQGSARGEAPYTYHAHYLRSPWFGTTDYHETAPAPRRSSEGWIFDVPTDRVLHIILGGRDVSAYREAYMMVQARTTGDARYQVGLDYDSNLTVEPGEVRPDAGVSDWASCTNGDTVTLSNPISTELGFCGYRPIVTSTPPPPTGSRDFVFEPGSVFRTSEPSSSFYCSSGWVTTIWGPSEAENLVSSPGGSIRSSAPYSWGSLGALTMYCESRRDWVDWRPWRGRPVSEISGFGTLTMCGTDIRSLAVVGTEAYPKPIISWASTRASCP